MTDVSAKSANVLPRAPAAEPQRRRRPFLSIRGRLIVVALVAIAPLMVERIRGLERVRADRAELARAEVVDLARSAAAAQREIVYSTRAMLEVIARVYAKLPADNADCSRMLFDLARDIPWIRGFAILGLDGRTVCASEPHALGLNLADRPYFAKALESRDFSLSDYLIGRLHAAPGIVATYPILKADDKVAGVVMASINLQWINELAVSSVERAGVSVVLIDGKGTVIAGSPDQAETIGKSYRQHELAEDMLANDEGTTTAAGFDGVRRIFAFARVPWTRTRVAIGLDESVVHSGIQREVRIAYVQLALFGLLVLFAAWFGGEQLIVKPIRTLVRMATRFGRGDLKVRPTNEPWLAEFEPLAAAFNDMARRLAAREEELKIANEHLEELASLDGLTGLANRRGFDREIELEYRRALEAGRPLALMMIDIDHFKLFNDRYGHVRGDACLRAVGETLSLVTIDDATVVARYGGEEFALLLPGLDMARTRALAEDARRAVEDLLITHAESLCGVVTISIGIESITPLPDSSAAALVEAADRALYDAKRRGRNTVVACETLLLRTAS